LSKIIITGRPGVGKTTIFMHVIDIVKRKGYSVGGIVCPEVREGGFRVGFLIIDLMTGRKDWLAHKRLFRSGPRIGRYVVNVEGAGELGANAIGKAISEADLIAIDEIGPMELLIPKLKKAIIDALKSNKPLLSVIHWRMRDSQILSLTRNAMKYYITEASRNTLKSDIEKRVLEVLENWKRHVKGN